jgi:hypothetical protein
MQRSLYIRLSFCFSFPLFIAACSNWKGSQQISVISPTPVTSPSRPVDKRVPSTEEWDKEAEQYVPKGGYKPEKGYVPDAQTAIKVAEAVLAPIYGEEQIKNERPFRATLKNGIWIVTGTLPENMDGGTAVVSISKDTGCVLGVTHYK